MLLSAILCGITTVAAVSPLAGVNIAGFDFGADTMGSVVLESVLAPLKALNGPDGAGQMQHFVQNDGLNTFRLPVSWQFLINSTTLASNITTNNKRAASGTLNPSNLNQYDELVQACLGTGAKCIIDIHNYARFENEIIGQGGPSDAEFANLWSQLATRYVKETNVIFGIMNEPHDIPDMKIWATTVQAAVTAIREAGATSQMILLPGNDFTGAETFVSNGSAGNLSNVHNLDGSNTSLIFDVHQYLDSDGSGTHQNCTSDHVQDTFMPLSKFLVTNGRQAVLSETGGGNATSCITDLCAALAFVSANTEAYIGYTGWGAGSLATDYVLSMTPFGAAGNFTDQAIVKQCIVGERTGLNATMTVQSQVNSSVSSATLTPSKQSTGGAKILRAVSPLTIVAILSAVILL